MQGAILAANRYHGEGRLLCFEMQAGQDRTTLHAVPCQQLDSDASAWAGSLGTGPNCNILMTSMAPAHLRLCCASGIMPEAAQHKVLGQQHSPNLPSLHTLTIGSCRCYVIKCRLGNHRSPRIRCRCLTCVQKLQDQGSHSLLPAARLHGPSVPVCATWHAALGQPCVPLRH